jgi:hypothetical protein
MHACQSCSPGCCAAKRKGGPGTGPPTLALQIAPMSSSVCCCPSTATPPPRASSRAAPCHPPAAAIPAAAVAAATCLPFPSGRLAPLPPPRCAAGLLVAASRALVPAIVPATSADRAAGGSAAARASRGSTVPYSCTACLWLILPVALLPAGAQAPPLPPSGGPGASADVACWLPASTAAYRTRGKRQPCHPQCLAL